MSGTVVRGRYGLPDSRGRTSPHVAQDEPAKPVNLNQVETFLNPQQFALLLRIIKRQYTVLSKPFLATNTSVQSILPEQPTRTYLFIQNQAAAALMSVGFGNAPGTPGVIPVNGLVIAANLGYYEPLICPTDELLVIGSAANVPGFLIYAA